MLRWRSFRFLHYKRAGAKAMGSTNSEVVFPIRLRFKIVQSLVIQSGGAGTGEGVTVMGESHRSALVASVKRK